MQLIEVEESVHEMVDVHQFDDVCTDLKNALHREEELQKLFEQQIDEIAKMELR